MLVDLYVEALLIDEDLADQVWELWSVGAITDQQASWAWLILLDYRGLEWLRKFA